MRGSGTYDVVCSRQYTSIGEVTIWFSDYTATIVRSLVILDVVHAIAVSLPLHNSKDRQRKTFWLKRRLAYNIDFRITNTLSLGVLYSRKEEHPFSLGIRFDDGGT